MKAIRFDGAGGAEVVKQVEAPLPELRPHDLLVRVRAAGLNRADLLQREGYYGANPDFGDSLIPGLELAGEVVSAGVEAKEFPSGSRVMAIVGGGAHAEFARVDARMAMPIPENLSYQEAAAIPEVFVTANEALLHLGELSSDGWALIHGATGGVGSAAIQLAHAVGARSIFTASGEDRIELVRQLGGTVGVDYRKEDFQEIVLRETEGRGVDVVVDFIGAPYFEKNMTSLAAGGRLIQVGTLGGSEARLSLDLLLHRHLRILGTVMKSRSFEEKLAMTARFRERWLSSFASGELAPVIDRAFPFAESAAAHRYMESSRNVGKVILTLE